MLIHAQRLLDATANDDGKKLKPDEIASITGLSKDTVRWLQKSGCIPDRKSVSLLADALEIPSHELSLRLGYVDDRILAHLRGDSPAPTVSIPQCPKPQFTSDLGELYQADCLSVMAGLPSESVDLIFADPPFNLAKDYPSQMDDAIKDEEYLEWSLAWLDECCRLLAFGGSLFVYNLPRWNARYSEYLSRRLNFRHAISIRMAYSLPIAGRLYPAHYSMLYLCKGPRPKRFTPDRLPMETCSKCYGDLVDYGGYKSKMNPKGVNITDVWTDIPPVRHSKYKRRKGANELSVKLLDRVIEMASEPGDCVFDPFGGSGTTYAVAEAKRRRWIGCEIGPLEQIIDRMENVTEEEALIQDLRSKLNALHTPQVKRERERRGIWTADTVKAPVKRKSRPKEEPSLFPKMPSRKTKSGQS